MIKFTPKDIQKQEFKKVIRGYDKIEVDTFLEMIAEEFEALLQSKSELEEKIQRHGDQLREFDRQKEEADTRLKEMKREADTSRASSQKESEYIIREAEQRARDTTEKAQKELKKIQEEILTLQKTKDRYILHLKKFLRTQYEIIKIFELNEKEIPGIQDVERRRRKGFVPENAAEEIKGAGRQSTERKPARAAETADSRAGEDREQDGAAEHAKPGGDEPAGAEDAVSGDAAISLSRIQDGFNLIDKILDDDENNTDTDSSGEPG